MTVWKSDVEEQTSSLCSAHEIENAVKWNVSEILANEC